MIARSISGDRVQSFLALQMMHSPYDRVQEIEKTAKNTHTATQQSMTEILPILKQQYGYIRSHTGVIKHKHDA